MALMTVSVSGIAELNAQLDRLRRLAPGECAGAVKELAIDIQREARQNVAVDTGLTRANILQWSDDGYRSAEIGVSARKVARETERRTFADIPMVAAIIEFGHGVIYPKKGKYLRWKTRGGKWVFAKSVRAMPPRPFLYPAWENQSRNMTKKIKDSILSIVKRTP